RLIEELRQAQWKPSPKTDADAECEFRYQPDGWSKPYRFVALRKQKPREELEAEETEQYQLFETSQYKYRVFVTDMSDPIYFVVAKIWRHAGRTGVSYSDHYEEKGVFERLMGRLRQIAPRAGGYAPVMLPALR